MPQVAFGADGSPSKALEGFCKKNGVSLKDVTTEADAKGINYVWAVVKSKGRPAAEVCAQLILPPQILGSQSCGATEPSSVRMFGTLR